MMDSWPALDEAMMREVAMQLAPYVLRTPTVRWPVPVDAGAPDCELFVKLELLQRTGSFKARGAINTIQHLLRTVDEPGKYPGVTAFSAGNHAIATAYAASTLGTTAKVVMPRTANAFRVEQCRAYGAELVFGDTIGDLMDIVTQIVQSEGRSLVHPFEGEGIVQGTATVGLELCDDVPQLDAVIVPVGGGGLVSGIASAVKCLQPTCTVFGVEPVGANGMCQSLAAGAPVEHVDVQTVADSLGAPLHAPLTFGLTRKHVDRIVTVTDEALKEAMRRMFTDLKLAVEPACGAALAALTGPLADELSGRRVALIACGSNIDFDTYSRLTN